MRPPPDLDVPITNYQHTEFAVDTLRRLKGGTEISVCVPAHNEAATIGPIIATIRSLMGDVALVDELVVVDDGSTDATAAQAAALGLASSPLTGQTRGGRLGRAGPCEPLCA